MGASLSWLAIRGKSPESARDELGLSTTGKFVDWPKSRYSGSDLENDWYLITARHSEQFVKDKLLSRLSLGCQIVACGVEEHVMVSIATEWQDGKQLWSITHDGQKGVNHLETKGNLPSMFPRVHDELRASQKAEDQDDPEVDYIGVDYIFNIPVDVAELITGFTHEGGGYTFEILERKGGNWLQKLLRRLGLG